MIQIQLKAKHFYFIVYHIKDGSIRQYYSVMAKIKSQLSGNTDDDTLIIVDIPYNQVVQIFRVLTSLPEGIAASINAEMLTMLNTQIISGVTQELTNGIAADSDGNLPETAYWQKLVAELTYYIGQNTIQRNSAIKQGSELINNI